MAARTKAPKQHVRYSIHVTTSHFKKLNITTNQVAERSDNKISTLNKNAKRRHERRTDEARARELFVNFLSSVSLLHAPRISQDVTRRHIVRGANALTARLPATSRGLLEPMEHQGNRSSALHQHSNTVVHLM